MDVIMKTIMAGPGGVVLPGKTVEVSDDIGTALVKGLFAVETASITPPDNAMMPKAQLKRGKKHEL